MMRHNSFLNHGIHLVGERKRCGSAWTEWVGGLMGLCVCVCVCVCVVCVCVRERYDV